MIRTCAGAQPSGMQLLNLSVQFPVAEVAVGWHGCDLRSEGGLNAISLRVMVWWDDECLLSERWLADRWAMKP